VEHFQRRELLAPLDPADVRQVEAAGNPPRQLPLRDALPEPGAPEPIADKLLEVTLGRHA